MAKRIIIELIDDISGESGATVTNFGLDGVDYEIHLVNDEALREKLAPWIAKSRALRPDGRAKLATAPGTPRRHDMHLVRAWARDNGLKTPARGRMPAAVIAAYETAKSTSGISG